MPTFRATHLLLDIEGTTSSVSYVFDVMFPYVRKHLKTFLEKNFDQREVNAACETIARDAGAKSLAEWCGAGASKATCIEKIISEVMRLMDGDVKATGLKELQGLIWRNGFLSGELRAHVYPDVPPALEKWTKAGLDIRIYSSGSIEAQKLFFGHTEAGDLLKFLRGHYDTMSGPKKSAESYKIIAKHIGAAPEIILFASDVVAELDAARQAAMQTVLVVRSGNMRADLHGHTAVESFAEIKLN